MPRAPAAALPNALIPPVVSTPPEFKVTAPAARPTPVDTPPLVVIVPTVIAPVLVTLTAPPAVSAAPVVVIVFRLVVPVPAVSVKLFAVTALVVVRPASLTI